MKTSNIVVGSIVTLGLNEFKVIAARDNIRYKIIVNEVGYIRSAVNCQTNEPVKIGILIEFFEPIEIAIIQYHNGFFIPINLAHFRRPTVKKEVVNMVALCKKNNQMHLQHIEGKHTHKKGFKQKLQRQGYEVKHVYIS